LQHSQSLFVHSKRTQLIVTLAVYYRFITLTIFIFAGAYSAFASTPIYLGDETDSYSLKGVVVDYLEDKSDSLSIYDVSSYDYKNLYSTSPHVLGNKNISSAYWLRFTPIDKTTHKRNWLVELFDFRIDYYELYMPDGHGHFVVHKGGAIYPFSEREYIHKNFVYDLKLPKQSSTIYIKIKANQPVAFIGAIRTYKDFTAYATTEYFCLALFYGIVVAMSLYNIFLFFALRDWTYLFYVLYVFSIGIYTFSQDGLGFEYLWPNYPVLNDYVYPVSVYSMVIWALFYARSFLNTKVLFPIMDKVIIGLILVRTALFVSEFFYPAISYSLWVDLVPLFVAYMAGVISFSSGHRMARFYVLAFTTLFGGFIITVMERLHLIEDSILTVYSFNFGVFCEMILLSLALADRIKVLNFDKETAQKGIITQLRENELLKDKVNLELEDKVRERTKELEFKNKELDTFVYRASHDIKGPLKSIIGLTSIGLKDVKDPAALNYFEHILKSSKRLDHLVADLLAVTQVKESRLKLSKIDFEKTIKEILYSLDHLPEYADVDVTYSIEADDDFFSDEKIIYSVFQNLIENAIKYRDTKKERSYLKIRVLIMDCIATIEFDDNGLGIEQENADKIFDMFYKVNESSSGSGLGLYMVKSSVERLEGSIKLQSSPGKGSVFTIKLKNNPAEVRLALK